MTADIRGQGQPRVAYRRDPLPRRHPDRHRGRTLDELWKLNVGSGFSAPPMTFEVNGRQYVAIVSGIDLASGKRRRANAPELNEQRNATVLYVFGL